MPFDTVGTPYNKVAVTPGFPALAPITTHRVGVGSAGAVAQVGGAVGTASSTVTIAGTVAYGQIFTISLTIPNPQAAVQPAGQSSSVLPNASIPASVSYTANATDTATTVATALKNAINSLAALTGLVTASSSLGVLTLTAATAGVTYPLSASVTGALATDSITVGGTFGAGRALQVVLTSASGAVVTVNYTTAAGDTNATLLGTSLAAAINASAAVVGLGAFLGPAVNTAGVIALNALVPGASQNAIALTATGAGGTTLTAGGATFTGGGSVATITASAADLDLTATVDPASTFANAQPGASGAVTFYQGMPTDVDAATKTDLRSQNLV